MNDQLSLLDPPVDTRRESYERLFERWIAWRAEVGKPTLRASSLGVYRDMWTTLTRALLVRGDDPRVMSEGDLAAVLESIQGSAKYKKRLIGLLDGVLQAAGAEPRSSAAWQLGQREQYRLADTREDERPPVTLNPAQQHALIVYLTTRQREGAWQRQRDRAIAVTIFGAGVKPGEALSLTWAGLELDDLDSVHGRQPVALRLPGRATSPPREVPLAPWAAAALADWIEVYDRLGMRRDPDQVVFPAAAGENRPINKSTFYRQFGEQLHALGIHPPKKGGHVLRHTFAVRQLLDDPGGRTLTRLRDWLGLARVESALPYAKVAARFTRPV